MSYNLFPTPMPERRSIETDRPALKDRAVLDVDAVVWRSPAVPLQPVHWRFLLVDFGLVAAAVNVVINGCVASLMFLGCDNVPLWGGAWLAGSMASDTIATCFLLPLLFTLIATPPVRRRVASGKLPPLVLRAAQLPWLDRLPNRARTRGLLLAALCSVTLAPATVWLLGYWGIGSMSYGQFVAFKSLYAGALALAVGPLIGAQAILKIEKG